MNHGALNLIPARLKTPFNDSIEVKKVYLSLKIFLKNGGEAVSLQPRRVARQFLEIFRNRGQWERKHDCFSDFFEKLAVDSF